MRCGLYGKLPAKRDFVAVGAPRAFLSAWEPWLQGGVSASRASLGPDWQAAYLQAPIWRFWLGADLCGAAAIGVLMPSVDGVGRYFPLTLFALADPGENLSPPEADPHAAWLSQAEEILLAALAAEASLEGLTARLDALGGPPASPPALADSASALGGRAWTLPLPGGGIATAAGRLRQADRARAWSGASLWWTQGGGDYSARALMSHGLPEPGLFAPMLTGVFPDGAEGPTMECETEARRAAWDASRGTS